VLEPNYPNPFHGQTTISFVLPEPGPVRLAVYDALGRRVAVLVDEVRAAGRHEVGFDGHGLPGGLYLYRIQATGSSATGRMVVVK
jgi:hypothetical protein